MTVYDQHGFRVLFHFARDPLPGRSDVLVVVVSMLSTAPQPIRNIVFQSAVPKVTGRVTWDLVGLSGQVVWSLSLAGVLRGEGGYRRETKDRAPRPPKKSWFLGY